MLWENKANAGRKEILFILNDNQLEYPMSITFNDYQYTIGENDENGNTLHFINDLFTNSKVYKHYEIQFHFLKSKKRKNFIIHQIHHQKL